MVIHRRELCARTGTLCFSAMQQGDDLTDEPAKVTCASCAERWQRLVEQFGHMLAGNVQRPGLIYDTGADPSKRADLLDLLARARAQGVRTLEVRADGGFMATFDPPAPAPTAAPPQAPPQTNPDEDAEQADAELVARGG